MNKLIQVNWDFSDYNSAKYPLDINSIPWYPATFPPPIPKFLVSLLSEVGDKVLDPFGGTGTTSIESMKLNRYYIYNDINPFAKDIVQLISMAIKNCSLNNDSIRMVIDEDKDHIAEMIRTYEKDEYEGKSKNKEESKKRIKRLYKNNFFDELSTYGINEDVIFWYHVDTLIELIEIYKHFINEDTKDQNFIVRKFAFVSILKEVCSQRGHFTYVTDNCCPKKIKYFSARTSYFAMLERIELSILDLLNQFNITYKSSDIIQLIDNSIIKAGDAKELTWIKNSSVDLVLTSPPYLCAQDYVKTMRLTNLFFPKDDFTTTALKEIGPRSKRSRNSDDVVSDFYSDMEKVFAEINRVLKPEKYFCFIIGQGKGKVTEGYNTVDDLTEMITSKYDFEKIYIAERKIGYKSVRIGGVDTETIFIFRKKSEVK